MTTELDQVKQALRITREKLAEREAQIEAAYREAADGFLNSGLPVRLRTEVIDKCWGTSKARAQLGE